MLGFLPSVWGLLSVSASLSSSVGLWGSERGNAVFKVSTIALTTICRGQRCKVRQKPPNEQVSRGASCKEDEHRAGLASGDFSSANSDTRHSLATIPPFLDGHKNLLPHRVKTNNAIGKEAKINNEINKKLGVLQAGETLHFSISFLVYEGMIFISKSIILSPRCE